MSKRKKTQQDDAGLAESSIESSSHSESESDIVNVEFELFDPQPHYDFHGIKMLLRQLFDVDAHLFDISALADLILAQPLVGSTVKVGGNDSDPYGLLTVLNFNEHRSQPVIADIVEYIGNRCKAVHDILPLIHGEQGACVGLVITERLINVPVEVMAPMYRMLLEEVTWALEESEPYQFSHYLILSKTYRESQDSKQEDRGDLLKHIKRRKVVSKDRKLEFYFHPEDEVLHRYAVGYTTYDYMADVERSDSKRAFSDRGIKVQGHAILIKAIEIEAAAQAVQGCKGQVSS